MIWWILLGIIGFILILYIVVGLLFHRIMFNKRFEKDPIVKYYSIDMFNGLKREPIEFEYKNGKIRGYIYSYDIPHKALIVFSHGMFSNHEAYLQDIEYLAKNGYKVLGFDYYGTSLSDGKNLRGLGNSLACLDFVISEVKCLKITDRIYVMGHSWGGFASLMIAKYHPDLDGVVTMAPFIKADNLLKGMVPVWLYPAIPFFKLIDRIKCGKYIYDNGIEVLKNSKINTLILHSKDDHMVKYYLNTYLLTEYIKSDNVKYLIINGKRHNPNYSSAAIDYMIKINEELALLPKEEKVKYRENIDYKLLGSLDEEIMDKIVEYFDNL